MNTRFYKYHGAGNDFILIDNRDRTVALTTAQVAALCNRHFGIGADGLMLLEHAEGYDFRMIYYNADGHEGSMCGNGGRCLTAFAKRLAVITDRAHFMASDGPHTATIATDGIVSLHMKDVADINYYDDHATLNTGSPHYVLWEDDVKEADVFGKGRSIRYLPEFAPGGTNVNFVQRAGEKLIVRTYERGVEDETLSCGTGVTASAIASTGLAMGHFAIDIDAVGGKLHVSFDKTSGRSAVNVILSGPAEFVFTGEIGI